MKVLDGALVGAFSRHCETSRMFVDSSICKALHHGYHNTSAVARELEQLVADHPDLASLYTIGRTVEGRDLTVLRISRGVTQVQGATSRYTIIITP